MSKPVIAVISMGGTIAMTPAATGGVQPGLDADALIASVPGLSDLDIEIVLFLIPSAVLGALLFFLILGSYVLGLFVPYALALLDWNEEDTEMHWAAVMIILLIGAGLLALVLGAPVGIVAWASRFVGPRQT